MESSSSLVRGVKASGSKSVPLRNGSPPFLLSPLTRRTARLDRLPLIQRLPRSAPTPPWSPALPSPPPHTPPPRPLHAPPDIKNHTRRNRDADDVSREGRGLFLGVEEGVDVEALGGVCDVGDGEVEGEEEDEEGGVCDGLGPGGGEEELEGCEGGVEGVLGYV